MGEYPLDVPEGTAVPAWAYQDVGLTDRWNISLTSTSTTLGPESTYYGSPTATRSYTPSMPSDAESTATQTSAGTGSATAGAITGGIIGGIGLLALIGALAWILIRRRRRKGDMDHPIGLFGPDGPPVGEADQHNLPAAVDYGAAYPHTPSPFTGSTSTMPKLYDPTDPTTFPPRTPVSFGYQSALPTGTDATPSNPLPSSPTHDHTVPTVHTAGRYSGAPEL